MTGRSGRGARIVFAVEVAAAFVFAGMLFSGTALSAEPCGTVLDPEGARLGLEREESGAYSRDPRDEGPWQVRTVIHVVRTDQGTGGLTEEEVSRSLQAANEDFAPLGITLLQAGEIDWIDSDAFYYDIDTLAEIDLLRETNVVDHALNIYFTEHLANQNGQFCGISSFTWSPHQGVVMMNACIPTIWNPSTFSHEVGHYFDLFHTHETAYGYECVDGSNCATAGDRICDTPADPRLNRCGPGGNEYCVDSYCVYTGTFVDPCHGEPYDPATDNMLAYSRPPCRTGFTPEQSAKAAATLVNLRADHIVVTTGVPQAEDGSEEAAGAPQLRAAVQNPVSRSIACRIDLRESGTVAARLLDASGRTVARFPDLELQAGSHPHRWHLAESVPSGLYFLQLDSRTEGGRRHEPVACTVLVLR